MASTSFVIEAIDRFTKTFDDMEKGFGKIEKAGESATRIGKDLTKKVTLPIAGVATAAIVAGTAFDSEMSKVQAISGATGDDLDALRDIAKEMGRTTQFSASESASALSYMSLA